MRQACYNFSSVLGGKYDDCKSKKPFKLAFKRSKALLGFNS
jgi:hypothetical protein